MPARSTLWLLCCMPSPDQLSGYSVVCLLQINSLVTLLYAFSRSTLWLLCCMPSPDQLSGYSVVCLLQINSLVTLLYAFSRSTLWLLCCMPSPDQLSGYSVVCLLQIYKHQMKFFLLLQVLFLRDPKSTGGFYCRFAWLKSVLSTADVCCLPQSVFHHSFVQFPAMAHDLKAYVVIAFHGASFPFEDGC